MAAALQESPPLEPSPAHTPLVPPPGVEPDGTVAAPPPTPATETAPLPPEPFADELPADFWGDDLLPPSGTQPLDTQGAPDAAELLSAAPSAAGRPVEGDLEADPRFVLLTELFPGRVTSWQAAAAETPADGADDADGVPETVDLTVDPEDGLDADEVV